METTNRQNLMMKRIASEGPLEISNAIIGLVDMVASTQISNALDVKSEWQLKSAFFAKADQLATELGVTLMNHTGDGFLFIIENTEGNWFETLNVFRERLSQEFKGLVAQHARLENVKTGLRFGVTRGSIIIGSVVGFSGALSVAGSSVNLAARLCSSAKIDEMVLCSAAWETSGADRRQAKADQRPRQQRTERRAAFKATRRVHTALKGFSREVAAVHVVSVVLIEKTTQSETTIVPAFRLSKVYVSKRAAAFSEIEGLERDLSKMGQIDLRMAQVEPIIPVAGVLKCNVA